MQQTRFCPGQVVATPAALDALSSDEIQSALNRHLAGDWGDCDPEDRDANELALQSDERLFSVYHTRDGERKEFWIITEADRSATTVLLPEDY
jgi:hypothetical protein